MQAIHDRVIIKRAELPDEVVGGIVIPTKEIANFGKVVAVGEGRLLDNGARAPMSVKVGDTVLFGDACSEFVKSGERFIYMRDEDIICVLEEEKKERPCPGWRKNMAEWNQKGFAVRVYDIGTDGFVWVFEGKHYYNVPKDHEFALISKFPEKYPQYVFIGDDYAPNTDEQDVFHTGNFEWVCDINWLRENGSTEWKPQ